MIESGNKLCFKGSSFYVDQTKFRFDTVMKEACKKLETAIVFTSINAIGDIKTYRINEDGREECV
jgi:hypothetical protein